MKERKDFNSSVSKGKIDSKCIEKWKDSSVWHSLSLCDTIKYCQKKFFSLPNKKRQISDFAEQWHLSVRSRKKSIYAWKCFNRSCIYVSSYIIICLFLCEYSQLMFRINRLDQGLSGPKVWKFTTKIKEKQSKEKNGVRKRRKQSKQTVSADSHTLNQDDDTPRTHTIRTVAVHTTSLYLKHNVRCQTKEFYFYSHIIPIANEKAKSNSA